MKHNSTTNRANRDRLRRYLASFALLLGAAFVCPCVSADVGVVLEEALDNGASRITASGHSAVYFSNICAESPVKLRLCRYGEQGSVVSVYEDFGENQNYGWNVVPLNIYMYGVADVNQRPLMATEKIKKALEEEYRKKFLAEYCSELCDSNPKADWRSTVGAAFNRSIYIFVVRTTTEQDLQFIRRMNALPNENHFSSVRRNCANFTKDIVNEYFPHSARADFLNDFGMTSPKAVARSFARFAHRRPDLEYHVIHYAQLPGTYKRSDKNRLGTELTFHAKLFLAPLVPLGIISIHETLPFFFTAYMITGRFNPEHEWEKHASAEATELGLQIAAAKNEKDELKIAGLQTQMRIANAATVGDSELWAERRAEFQAFIDQAAKDPSAPKISSTKRTFKELDRAGTPVVDEGGSIWMELRGENGQRKVGIAEDNVLSTESNRHLAYEIILARVTRALKSPTHSREMISEFQDDWALLQQAHERITLSTSLLKDAPQRLTFHIRMC
jgi:hypothetical protein